jgi:hypothetical protein
MRFSFAGPLPASSQRMRPLSQPTFDFRISTNVFRQRLAQAIIFLFAIGTACSCSQSAPTGGAPLPPPSIEVSVTPQSENITREFPIIRSYRNQHRQHFGIVER